MKTILLLGAGATRSTAAAGTVDANSPPLDKGFFSEANESNLTQSPVPTYLKSVQDYLQGEFGYNLYSIDSLEAVMNVVFSGVAMGSQPAASAMIDLIRLFQKRIEVTTRLRAADDHPVRRLVSHLLESVDPQEITIITFNQDLEAEKALDELANDRDGLFALPSAYCLLDPQQISGSGRGGTFDHVAGESAIKLLKLHGSLNWYRRSSERNLQASQLTSRARSDFFVGLWRSTNRKSYRSRQRTGRKTWYVFPVVIPPISGKDRLFPRQISQLWEVARAGLEEAERLIVFGYSCPEADVEASNLIRSAAHRSPFRDIVVIDKSPGVIPRFADLTDSVVTTHFRHYEGFLRHWRQR